MHYIYKITILFNSKIYIGQTIDPKVRWNQHILESKREYPSMIINRAMKKHCFTDGYFDPKKCLFEVIACCILQEDTNDIEELIIAQENSHIRNKMGYNVSLGGNTSPKSDEWKKMLSDWHASLTPEQKLIRSQKISNWHASLTQDKKAERSYAISKATKLRIAKNGHPLLGKKNPTEYTPELRKKMSDAHVGIKDTEETKQKKAESATAAWSKRNEIIYADPDMKCHAPGCDVQGKAEYLVVDGIRYCNLHGQRLKRTGHLELQPIIPHNKGKKISEETRQKLLGRTPHNKISFSNDDMSKILSDTRSNKKIARDFGVTEKVIKRIKSEY